MAAEEVQAYEGGWEQTPTPCPQCGATVQDDTTAVQVRRKLAPDPETGDEWEFRCLACGANGPAHAKDASTPG